LRAFRNTEAVKARARNAKKKAPARREPKQRRARETVTAVLDAVVRVLKKGGSPRSRRTASR
jgi:hypothetical protein